MKADKWGERRLRIGTSRRLKRVKPLPFKWFQRSLGPPPEGAFPNYIGLQQVRGLSASPLTAADLPYITIFDPAPDALE